MPDGDAPSGVVTFLFTDIEGSTRRWEADADAMRAALAAHDGVLRGAIDAHGGLLFKHTGDGVCAAFSSPTSAVDAAITAQRKLELPVRMGMATGEAEVRDGDYFGPVLNRAARVMAAGHGGQVLLAESTASLLTGVDLVDLGPRRLRDVPTLVGLFQVRAAGLQTEFAPLRTLDAPRGNLRLTTTSFIGRESEVADIAAAVKSHRLVTLIGVGGVGKTRLAFEAAARLADEFPEGVWVFELAAVSDPAAVPDAVAAVLGITQQPGKSVSESVAATLEGRLRLLVFDNCEHVIDAAAELIEIILRETSTVRILVTSREGLSVADEQVWPVPPLNVDGVDSAAADLFVERAHGVSQHLAMSDAGEAAAVVELCRRLDGIPLAIELAASRMASMTANEVRDRLDQRFRLLVGTRRGSERHQTLRHAVAWSYDLLDEAEQDLLNHCSVFAGGFDIQSACAVAGPNADEFSVLDSLDALVRKSLLVASQSAGSTRFSMLETIRQFAAEKLAERGQADEMRMAHARYFASLESEMIALWDSPRQRDAYEWFAAELSDLRIAFRWAADHAQLDTAATIATLTAFLGVWVENYEASHWADELIESARAANHPRLAFIYAMAALGYFTGRLDASLSYADAAFAVMAEGGADVPFGVAANFTGGIYLSIGRPDRWVDVCRAHLERTDDSHSLVRGSLVLALASAGLPEEAVAATRGLVEAAEAVHNPASLSYALLASGYAKSAVDPARAVLELRRGLQVALDHGVGANASVLAMTMGSVEANHGDTSAALDCIGLAIRNYRDSGNISVIGVPLANLAIVLDRLELYEPAARIAGFSYSPMTVVTIPGLDAMMAHLEAVLGSPQYDSMIREGAAMTPAAVATLAYDAIGQAREELERR